MLGRHQLRAKTLEVLYSNEINPKDELSLRKQLMNSLNEVYNLYLSKFSVFMALQKLAEKKIELSKKKQLPTESDLNPNTSFRDNRIFTLISSNTEIEKHLSKNDQLKWKSDDVEILKIYEEIKASDLYENYVKNTSQTFSSDRRFCLRIFKEFISQNQLLNEQYEDKNLYWADYSSANSMVVSTIESFTAKSKEDISMYKVFKNKDDEDYVKKLLSEVLQRNEFLNQEIEKYIRNWDLDRLAKIDKVILQMAICEICYFPSIPDKVIINEYIELSKEYSSDKSKVYINGILDKIIKDTRV